MKIGIGNRILAAGGLVALLCAAPSAAQASPIIVGGAETVNPNALNSGFMQGYDFTSLANQSLTALGFWDSGANGLPSSYQVGLWETSTQMLLVSATIDNSDPLDTSNTVWFGQWRYESLSVPIALSAGTSYTLAFQVGSVVLSSTDALLITAALAVNPNVMVDPSAVRVLQTSAFAFPTNYVADVGAFRGNVNAQLVSSAPSPVPEPSTVALLGLGLLGAAAVRSCRRRTSGVRAATVAPVDDFSDQAGTPASQAEL